MITDKAAETMILTHMRAIQDIMHDAGCDELSSFVSKDGGVYFFGKPKEGGGFAIDWSDIRAGVAVLHNCTRCKYVEQTESGKYCCGLSKLKPEFGEEEARHGTCMCYEERDKDEQ